MELELALGGQVGQFSELRTAVIVQMGLLQVSGWNELLRLRLVRPFVHVVNRNKRLSRAEWVKREDQVLVKVSPNMNEKSKPPF